MNAPTYTTCGTARTTSCGRCGVELLLSVDAPAGHLAACDGCSPLLRSDPELLAMAAAANRMGKTWLRSAARPAAAQPGANKNAPGG